jgi:hypothetical protein
MGQAGLAQVFQNWFRHGGAIPGQQGGHDPAPYARQGSLQRGGNIHSGLLYRYMGRFP